MAAKGTIEIHLENSCFHFMDYQMNFFCFSPYLF